MKNYFFAESSWISNLGVVPLFLFSAFLLEPALTLLLDLTFFVILVFETIFNLPNRCGASIKFCNNLNYLLSFWHNVKVFLAGLLISTLYAHAKAPQNSDTLVSMQNVIISTGEHREIQAQGLREFTIGNKEVISSKHQRKTKKLLIKGKRQGFSELILWTKKGEKHTYKVYVLSKLKYLRFLHLTETLQKIGLQTEIAGPIIIVHGVLHTLDQYRLIKKIRKENDKYLHIKVHFNQLLKNKIIGAVYKAFFDEYIDTIQCEFELITIYCRYPESNIPANSTLKEMQQRYAIKFNSYPDQSRFRNFKIKMKLIQIEKMNGEELNFGLDQINGNLGELFNSGLMNVIEKNKFSIGQRKLHLSTLAEPEMLIKLEEQGVVEVGSNIPFQVGSENNKDALPALNWKFAGLKIKIKILKRGKDIQLKYKTEFTRPDTKNSMITGSKESGTALVPLNRPLQLFQIGFKTLGHGEGRLPWLGSIPLLGRIFKSNSNKSTYKKISGVIIIQENEI